MKPWLFLTGLIASACYAGDQPRADEADRTRAAAVEAALQRSIGIDLDRPGAMAALERQNPSHFAKIERLLREAPKQSFASIPRWMRTQFDAKDVQTYSLLKTSYPPQARVSFVLDNARYSKTIYVDAPAKVIPAK
jgi:hypothetical protein